MPSFQSLKIQGVSLGLDLVWRWVKLTKQDQCSCGALSLRSPWLVFVDSFSRKKTRPRDFHTTREKEKEKETLSGRWHAWLKRDQLYQPKFSIVPAILHRRIYGRGACRQDSRAGCFPRAGLSETRVRLYYSFQKTYDLLGSQYKSDSTLNDVKNGAPRIDKSLQDVSVIFCAIL